MLYSTPVACMVCRALRACYRSQSLTPSTHVVHRITQSRWEDHPELHTSDWRFGAAALGNAVLQTCARTLILVEGTAEYGTEWGESFKGLDVQELTEAPDPVPLSNRYKLVMSPHSYGPSLYDVPELLQYFPERFLEPTYPANLRAYWEENWGFLQGKGLPLLISEMGGNMACCDIPGVFENPDADRLYQEELVRYLGEMGVGLFYFTLNPGSHDTGGVLEADWKTSNEMKLNLLSRVKATRVLP